ncbi:hypothetical protein DL96DRAFT_1705895 [Flagelloscypha sp. PMI_526]|nr:hypothetical protein DL96DRAFT_1705895 [Flagelloscypha sp. PMI_526]
MPAITPSDPLYGITIYVMGGWFIGGCLVLLLFGVLTCQVTNYFTYYKADKTALRISVGGLYLLALLKVAQAFALLWIHSILWGADPAGALKLQQKWFILVNIPLGAVISLYVQLYYVHRLWALSRAWWAVAPVVIVMLLGFVAALITASSSSAALATTGKSSDWFAIYNACSFVTDILITVITTTYLLRAKKKVFARSKRLVDSLVRLAVQTAVPASICTLIMLICSRLGSKSLLPQPPNAIILGLLHALPIIYANCMMYILNTRRTLRLAGSSGANTSSGNPSNALRAGHRAGQTSEHDIGGFSGIQVTTQVNTISDASLQFHHQT